jgi:hypothetical protein
MAFDEPMHNHKGTKNNDCKWAGDDANKRLTNRTFIKEWPL